ncbi:hypothetical protein HN51_027825, partial [Arachis hypogaea]
MEGVCIDLLPFQLPVFIHNLHHPKKSASTCTCLSPKVSNQKQVVKVTTNKTVY